MAKKPNRIAVYSALAQSHEERPLRWVKTAEAFEMHQAETVQVRCLCCGLIAPQSVKCTKSQNGEHWLIAQMRNTVREKRSTPTITLSEMAANAGLLGASRRDDDFVSCAVAKVHDWPLIGDTKAPRVPGCSPGELARLMGARA